MTNKQDVVALKARVAGWIEKPIGNADDENQADKILEDLTTFVRRERAAARREALEEVAEIAEHSAIAFASKGGSGKAFALKALANAARNLIGKA